MLTVADTEAVLKAARLGQQRAEGESPEVWAEPIEASFLLGLDAMRQRLGDDMGRLVGAQLAKAQGAVPLTATQIEELKLLVRQHYLAHIMPMARAAFWDVPEATKQRWREWGILGPAFDGEAHAAAAIDEMVVAARVAEILEHGTTFRRMRQMAMEQPETRAMQLARQIARQHAGYAIERIADRHGDLLRTTMFDAAQRDLLGRLVADFLGGRMGVGTANLTSALREQLGSPDFDRDWQRVAVSETRWAYNYGSLVHYLEQGWGKVYYHVQPDACDYCKRLLLNRDGTPRVFDLDDIIETIAEDGGTNSGRSASKIGKAGGWRPTALIHPWCRCRPLPYLAGFPTAPRGDRR